MNWVVFAVTALVALVVDQTPLLDGLALDRDGAGRIKPVLCATVAVFIALAAPRALALWACLLLGLLMDLSTPVALPGHPVGIVYLIGPQALGYAAGAWLVLNGRAMLFRQKPLTVGVMTFAFLVLAGVVAVVVYQVRSWYPGPQIIWTDAGPWSELGRRLLSAIYTGLFAIPVGWLLVRSTPIWGFEPLPGNR